MIEKEIELSDGKKTTLVVDMHTLLWSGQGMAIAVAQNEQSTNGKIPSASDLQAEATVRIKLACTAASDLNLSDDRKPRNGKVSFYSLPVSDQTLLLRESYSMMVELAAQVNPTADNPETTTP